jgi:hypothetical protein
MISNLIKSYASILYLIDSSHINVTGKDGKELKPIIEQTLSFEDANRSLIEIFEIIASKFEISYLAKL